MSKLKSLLVSIYLIFRGIYHRFYFLCILIFHKNLYNSETYFPEYISKRKSIIHIFFYQVVYISKYGVPNLFYFLYGFDIKGLRNQNDYVDYGLFMNRREKMNNKHPFSLATVLRDKSLFGIVANAYGISTPENIGIITNGNIYLFSEKRTIDFIEYIKEEEVDAFMKKIDGECADGVYHITSNSHTITIDSLSKTSEDIRNIVKVGVFLLQRSIKSQHKDINAIFAKSVNTIRLVTVQDTKSGTILPLTAVLRVGKGESCVDNWAAGGLSIGVDISTGRLRKYGFYKPGYGTKAKQHPDSGIVFEGYQLPYFREAIDLALRYHQVLNNVHSIGWDIAILDDGPTIIEGNDNWEISLMEVSNYGLKKEFDRYFYE